MNPDKIPSNKPRYSSQGRHSFFHNLILIFGVFFLSGLRVMEFIAKRIFSPLEKINKNIFIFRFGVFIFKRGVQLAGIALLWVPVIFLPGLLKLRTHLYDEIGAASGVSSVGWLLYLIYFIGAAIVISFYLFILFFFIGSILIIGSYVIRGKEVNIINIIIEILYVLGFWLLNMYISDRSMLEKGLYTVLVLIFLSAGSFLTFKQWVTSRVSQDSPD